MAEKGSIDPSEFEKSREEILKMEKEAEWKLAKQFEHTEMYRRSDNESVYKVSHIRFLCNVINAFFVSVRSSHGRHSQRRL